jgi:two-component system, NarL family, sensor histidine kinase NreB
MQKLETHAVIAPEREIIYVLDSEGQFVLLKGAHEKMIGYSNDELMGRHYSEVVLPCDSGRARYHFNERRTGDRATRRHPMRLVRKGCRDQSLCLPVQLDATGMWGKSSSVEEKEFCGTFGVARSVPEGPEPHSMMDCLDRERERIAAELHDGIGQLLVSLKIELEAMKAAVGPRMEMLRPRLEKAIERTTQGMRDLRRVSLGLKPLLNMDLVPAMLNLVGEVKRWGGIRIWFHHYDEPQSIHAEKKVALFRIAQEALTNAVKHSKAGQVHVSLTRAKGAISMSIEDDGLGFDMETAWRTKDRPSFGLLTMQERAEQAGGEFVIESAAGRGTLVLVEMPLD